MQYLSFYALDLHEIWNRDLMQPGGHIPFMIKDISTSQEPPASSKPPSMSLVCESVLDYLKLNRFQPNFKHSFLLAYLDNSNPHQGHLPHSGMSLILVTPATTASMSLIFERVLDGFKLHEFLPNFKHLKLLQNIWRWSKISSMTQAPVRNVHYHHEP